MSQARQWLIEHGISFEQMTDYQLKIGRINFYPGKGTIFRDGDKTRHSVIGLEGLADLLKADGHMRPNSR
jgi:hypothetical protein